MRKKTKTFQIVEIYLGHTTHTESGPPFPSKQECFGFPINLINNDNNIGLYKLGATATLVWMDALRALRGVP